MADHPHNTPSGVNDTALPTRRRVGTLLAAGAVLALPSGPSDASTVDTQLLLAAEDEAKRLDAEAEAIKPRIDTHEAEFERLAFGDDMGAKLAARAWRPLSHSAELTAAKRLSTNCTAYTSNVTP